MNTNELQKKETEATNSTASVSTENTETIVPPAVMNPPAPNDSDPDVLSKELSERIKTLDTLVKNLTKNFVKIGYELVLIRQKKLYKELDFKTFEDFVQTQYGFSRSSAYNFINVCLKYSVKDDAGQPTKLLSKEYAKFSSSQLVAMLKLNDEAIAQVDPNATIKDIKKLSASKTSEANSSDESEEDEENEDADKKEKKEKKNIRDMNIPVMRLNMATGATWDSVVTDAIRKVCEPFLNDERRAADGKAYKIEINIVYPDESAM